MSHLVDPAARPGRNAAHSAARLDRRTLFKATAAAAALLMPAAATAGTRVETAAVIGNEATLKERSARMTSGGFSPERLARMKGIMDGHVESGELPGFVWALHRKGETIVEAGGSLAVGGAKPMQRDTIFRIASLTKPVTAVAAMILVEECKVRLDDPVDAWLPELADRKVLKAVDGRLDDMVPARRAITLRDLLTQRLGLGAIMVWPSAYPIQHAMDERGVSPSPKIFGQPSDEYMRRLGELPLAYQPGDKWLYDTGLNVAGVLVERVAGQKFGTFLKERIFDPLGMKDTGFHVPPEKIERLADFYMRDHAAGTFAVFDNAEGGLFASPPVFEAGSGGLVSTADDYLALCRMLLGKGRLGDMRILSRPSVELMTADHLSAAQKATSDAEMFFAGNTGWGFGMGVATRRDELWLTPGRFGWDGGYGTSGYTDPAEDLIGVLLTQRLVDSPVAPRHFTDFWTGAYQAIAD